MTPERLDAVIVLGDLFRVLQVKPALGREFLKEELQNGGFAWRSLPCVLAEAVCERCESIGRAITLDGYPYTIVRRDAGRIRTHSAAHAALCRDLDHGGGRFHGAWTQWERASPHGLPRHWAPGSRRYAGTRQAEFNVIANGLKERGSAIGAPVSTWRMPVMKLRRISGRAAGSVRGGRMRAADRMRERSGTGDRQAVRRQHETAIRAALGASRSRLMRESLMESLVISVAGSALGLLAAQWLLRALEALSPIHLEDMGDLRMDGTVALFVLALSLGNVLLFGLLPALLASRSD